jgi:hypothetical protein
MKIIKTAPQLVKVYSRRKEPEIVQGFLEVHVSHPRYRKYPADT